MPIVEVAASFPHGYMSDIPRDQLPANAAYRMKDWIPGLDGRLRGRGGWKYTSPDLTSLAPSATSICAVAWAPFATDEHLLILASSGTTPSAPIYDINLDATVAHAATVVSGPAIPTCPPFWHEGISGAPSGGLVIPIPRGSAGPAGASVTFYEQAFGIRQTKGHFGKDPQAYCGASWGDYLLLANGTSAGVSGANAIWISAVGDPTTWATGTNFWESQFIPDIVHLATTRNGILVLGFENTSLISGDTPPAGGNWSEGLIFHGVGCFDARTVDRYGDSVVFADNLGVYMTDGITLTDLAQAAGVKTRWKQLVGTFNASTGWSAAGGVYRNYYVISVHDDNGNFVTCHVFDIVHQVAFEFTNIRAAMFAHTPLSGGTSLISGEERLFMAPRNGTHVEGLHFAWTNPDSMTDGDASLVLPQLETPYYKLGGAGRKRFRSMRGTYDARGAASLSVDYCTTPGGSYTNAGSLPTTTDETRTRVDIRDSGVGIGLRLTQVGSSTHSTLSDLELDQTVLEGMR